MTTVQRCIAGAMAAASLVLATAASAQVPRFISYQGLLAGLDGRPVTDGNYSMTFRLYTQPTGGTPIWEETRPTLTVENGLFNVILGQVTPLGIDFSQQYWLGTTVGANPELTPRTQLASAPYALRTDFADSARSALSAISADSSRTVADGAITSVKLAAQAVTLDKIDPTGSTPGQVLTRTTTGLAWQTPQTGSTGSITTIQVPANGGLGISNPNGPNTTISILPAGILEPMLSDDAVSTRVLRNGAVTTQKISNEGSIPGQSLIATATGVTWGYPSKIRLPYIDSADTNGPVLRFTNTNNGQYATGLEGFHGPATGTGAGVLGATNSTDANAVGVMGVVTSTAPGGFSSAVRGANNGTGGLGIGVYGSQAGSGWGVYGTTPSGIGVHGNSTNGYGVYGLSTNGTASYGLSTNGQAGLFEITNAANTNNALTGQTVGSGVAVRGVTTGTGGAASFQINNPASTSTAVGVNTNGIGSGVTVQLTNASNGARGIDVAQSGVGPGVFATSAGGNAVWGITSSISAAGVIGDNTFGEAVVGRNRGGNGVGAVVGRNDSSGYGVRGFNTKDGIGVLGQAGISGGTGTAGRFENLNAANINTAVAVNTNGIGSGVTVQLTNASNGARGIDVLQAGVGPGVFATSAGGNAVWGITSSISAAGVIGDNTFGEAVVGRNRGGNGVGAVVGRNDSSGYGVRGFNTKNGIGVIGQAGISGGIGVGGRFENVNAANTSAAMEVATNGIGSGITVQLTNASNGARGIDVAQSGVGPGVFATSAGGNAVWGITSSISAAGVIGDNTFGEAVVGRNRGGNGVGAVVGRNDSSGYGVRGFNTKNGYGVLGQAGISGGTGTAGRFENVNAANTSDALQVVTNSAGNAARFTGNVVVTGNLTVSGTVAKGGGSFMIDHPLDPTNKILYHSFVESPDMKNINDGVVKLDERGEATVTMPDWFQALNGDFRYQLTAIGAQAPGLYIAEEVNNNHFKIAGGKPGMKVSWQVTGIRHDPYAEKHRIQVEVEKTPEQRGHYLHPDAYGVDEKAGSSKVESTSVNSVGGSMMEMPSAAPQQAPSSSLRVDRTSASTTATMPLPSTSLQEAPAKLQTTSTSTSTTTLSLPSTAQVQNAKTTQDEK